MTDEEVSQAALQHSIIGRVGRYVEPVFRPLGFDWRVTTALIGAFAAKEVFVAQMGIVYSLGAIAEAKPSTGNATRTRATASDTLRARLRADYPPLVGFCIMLFCLIAAPCMATVAVTRRETAWRWALLQFAGLTVIAYVITLIVYQCGTLFQIGTAI